MKSSSMPAALVLLALLLAPSHAHAAWTQAGIKIGDAPFPIEGGGYFPLPRAAPDGSGGAFVAWSDARNHFDYGITAQRVRSDGTLAPGWPPSGAVAADEVLDQMLPTIVADGSGGAFIAWLDYRNATPSDSTTDIYLQHVTAAACPDPSWPPDGVPVVTAPRDQDIISMIADGAGGAFIGWADRRPAQPCTYLQHMSSSGAPAPGWIANGIPLQCGVYSGATLVLDGAGGIFAFCIELVSGSLDVVVHRIVDPGVPAPGWTAQGVDLTPFDRRQLVAAAASDGDGGATVVWTDLPSFSNTPGMVVAARIDATGAVRAGWPAEGVVLRNTDYVPAWMTLAADGTGGAILTWYEDRLPGNDGDDVFAQRILGSGTIAAGWPANAAVVSDAAGNQFFPRIVSDAGGGGFIVWDDSPVTSGYPHVFAQHLDGSGMPAGAWPTGGARISSRDTDQSEADVVSSIDGGVIASWTDFPDPFGSPMVFANRLASAPVAAVDGSALPTSRLRVDPNPSRGRWRVSFRMSEAGPTTIHLLDVGGRSIVARTIEGTAAGDQTVWVEPEEIRPGVYFVVLEQGGARTTRRVCVMR